MFPLMRRVVARQTQGAGRRFMGGGHGHADAKNYPFGMHFHVSPVHKNLAKAYGTMLWLWIFWRAKQDGKVVLGLEHPWDHHGGDHHDDHHGSSSHGAFKYERTEVGERPTLVQAEEVEEDEE